MTESSNRPDPTHSADTQNAPPAASSESTPRDVPHSQPRDAATTAIAEAKVTRSFRLFLIATAVYCANISVALYLVPTPTLWVALFLALTGAVAAWIDHRPGKPARIPHLALLVICSVVSGILFVQQLLTARWPGL